MSNNLEFEFEADEPVEYQLTREELRQAVLFTTDWTVETAITQLDRNNISLDPAFQRRDAWRVEKKSRFIESILLGLPVPQIVLAEDRETRGQFIVLDGKQRLLTLLQFAGRAPNSKWNSFKLKELTHLLTLEKHSLQDMERSKGLDSDLHAFWNYPIRSSVIRNWPNTKYLETIFVRLNEGSLRLSPQELRQALSPGPFASFIDEFASSSSAVRKLLGNEGPDFRMRDTELLLRLLAFAIRPEQYAGDMKSFLDSTTDELNRKWTERREDIEASTREVNNAIEAGLASLGANFARKLDRRTKTFSPYLNRAIAEVEVYYLRDPKLADWAVANADEFKSLLIDLMTEDDALMRSLESTTKSLTAVSNRFQTVGEALRRRSGIDLKILRQVGNRLAT